MPTGTPEQLVVRYADGRTETVGVTIEEGVARVTFRTRAELRIALTRRENPATLAHIDALEVVQSVLWRILETVRDIQRTPSAAAPVLRDANGRPIIPNCPDVMHDGHITVYGYDDRAHPGVTCQCAFRRCLIGDAALTPQANFPGESRAFDVIFAGTHVIDDPARVRHALLSVGREMPTRVFQSSNGFQASTIARDALDPVNAAHAPWNAYVDPSAHLMGDIAVAPLPEPAPVVVKPAGAPPRAKKRGRGGANTASPAPRPAKTDRAPTPAPQPPTSELPPMPLSILEAKHEELCAHLRTPLHDDADAYEIAHAELDVAQRVQQEINQGALAAGRNGGHATIFGTTFSLQELTLLRIAANNAVDAWRERKETAIRES